MYEVQDFGTNQSFDANGEKLEKQQALAHLKQLQEQKAQMQEDLEKLQLEEETALLESQSIELIENWPEYARNQEKLAKNYLETKQYKSAYDCAREALRAYQEVAHQTIKI